MDLTGQPPGIRSSLVLVVGCAAGLILVVARLVDRTANSPSTPNPFAVSGVARPIGEWNASPQPDFVPSNTRQREAQAHASLPEIGAATGARIRKATSHVPDRAAFEVDTDEGGPNLTRWIASLNSASAGLTRAQRGALIQAGGDQNRRSWEQGVRNPAMSNLPRSSAIYQNRSVEDQSRSEDFITISQSPLAPPPRVRPAGRALLPHP
jgi:hypothetical protein